MFVNNKWCLPFSRLKYVAIVLLVCCNFWAEVQADHVTETSSTTTTGSCSVENENATSSFAWPDYLVLGSMLVVSCGIGVFYGFVGPKHENSQDFLLGGSCMGTFPMAMSLAASFVTAVELLGNPAEMYTHGSQFWVICAAFVLVVPLTSKLYLPVFMTLRLTSSYEYLSMRFCPKTKYLASGLYIVQMVLYTSVAVYAPALALSKVTGLNVYLAVTVVYVVCIFYASQGGMKAVIIADTFQAGVLIGSILLILCLGHKFVGGTGNIWSDNYSTDRLELFNLETSPTVRHSFWSVVIGGTFYWMTMFCSNQASIQKYMSVETIGQVRTALWTSCFGLILIYTINFYTGMIMVTHFKNCDPLQSGAIDNADEILPYYVIKVMGYLRGLTGFFVAGIFAASLGTVASALNSLAAVTMQDFLAGLCGVHFHDHRGAFWAKCISVVYGLISFGLVFIVAQLGSVMQVAISFNGMVGGVTLGLFSLGMFFPWANYKGALFGSIVAMALITLMCIGQQIAIASNSMVEEMKPTSVDQCSCLITDAVDNVHEDVSSNSEPQTAFIYRISYIWYSAIGFLVTVLLGLAGSFATGPQNPHEVDGDLLSPPFRDFYNSLSNPMKEFLNLPLKQNVSRNLKELNALGVLNGGLEINEEKMLNGVVNSVKIRKVSAPT